eukprot:12155370-Alexandrium_andersonii.AAC.1
MIAGKCGCHQAHRIVESRERPVAGDLHAVAVTCKNVGLQNRMQTALKEVLREELHYVIGFADPAWRDHNASVLLHTVFRKESQALGSLPDFGVAEVSDFPVAVRCLTICKGDWSRPRAAHYTNGDSMSRDEVADAIFA